MKKTSRTILDNNINFYHEYDNAANMGRVHIYNAKVTEGIFLTKKPGKEGSTVVVLLWLN